MSQPYWLYSLSFIAKYHILVSCGFYLSAKFFTKTLRLRFIQLIGVSIPCYDCSICSSQKCSDLNILNNQLESMLLFCICYFSNIEMIIYFYQIYFIILSSLTHWEYLMYPTSCCRHFEFTAISCKLWWINIYQSFMFVYFVISKSNSYIWPCAILDESRKSCGSPQVSVWKMIRLPPADIIAAYKLI